MPSLKTLFRSIVLYRRSQLLPSGVLWRSVGVASLIAMALGGLTLAHREPVVANGWVAIVHPWASGIAVQGGELAVNVTFVNRSDLEDRLTAIETEAASRVAVRDPQAGRTSWSLSPGIIALTPNSRTSLAPGKQQIVLVGLSRRLNPGDKFSLTFVFEKAGRLSAGVRIEEPGEPRHGDHA